YQQFGPFDHPDEGEGQADDPIQLGFSYTIQDGSGTQTTGSLTVTVNDDEPTGTVVKEESVQFGQPQFNIAYVVDVSNSTVRDLDGTPLDVDPNTPGDQSRLSVEIAAIKASLQQAIDAGVVGPVLIVAFHGLVHFNSVPAVTGVDPVTISTSFASVSDALAGVDAFFASLGGPPFDDASPNTSPNPGSTKWEGGLDVAADWFGGALPPGVTNGVQNVPGADNRLFFLTDGGNNQGIGGFNPNQFDVARLYTNAGSLGDDIPNLTIRTVAILNGDTSGNPTTGGPNGVPDADDFASIVDQSDDNLINGSATIVTDAEGAEGIVFGFGTLNPVTQATGNLFVDDDLIGGPGADGLKPIIGADGPPVLFSFTFFAPDNTNNPGDPDPDSDPDVVTIFTSGTHVTALGGTITVDFSTGNYTYNAPTSGTFAVEEFTYVIHDGDDDPLNGSLIINISPAGTIADNSGFETDTLLFWSAAGSVWVEDAADITSGAVDGDFAAVLHTGGQGSNAVLTPDADRTVYNQADLEGFISDGDPGLAVNLDTTTGFDVLSGAVLKGEYELDLAPGITSVDVQFDWQFLTDVADADGGENDLAFVVVEGQLFVLANADNQGSFLDTVDGGAVTVDGQAFSFSTSYNQDTLLSNITDVDGDGVIHVAFGVVNAGSANIQASALIIDDVNVAPHV
ncbi:MAG: hypothetical protein AB7P52_13380, partial [Alphaproteobacteria bacterium]